jgi:hypothetical protein
MADEVILKKERFLELDRVVEKVSNELEESFGLFYIKRSMKKISEPESKPIKNLQEKLDEMKNKIEIFQRDLLQVFFLKMFQLLLQAALSTERTLLTVVLYHLYIKIGQLSYSFRQKILKLTYLCKKNKTK